jgi:RNA polymerase sigma-70 factor (ECF subfamily)
MNGSNVSELDGLIARARSGDREVLNQLITYYRPYLKVLARLQKDLRLQSKLDDSDLVQEASALAIADFPGFLGDTERELTGWLRTLMARVAAQSFRHHTAQRRDVGLERSLQQAFDASSQMLSTRLVAPGLSPSEQAIKRERAVLVAEVLEQLPEHYREVIILRDFEGLKLSEVATRMQRSEDSVRKIWARAMVDIRKLLKVKI